MDDKLMYITNNNTQYYPFCRLNKWLKLMDWILNLHSTNQSKVPKVVKATNKKTYYKTFGTIVPSLSAIIQRGVIGSPLEIK